MKRADVRRALEIVQTHQAKMLQVWRDVHG